MFKQQHGKQQMLFSCWLVRLISLFFCCMSWVQASEDAEWNSLLHIHNATASIHDPSFLLTPEFQSADATIAATQALFSTHPDAICRFPARYLLLKKQGRIQTLPDIACSEFAEFKANVPFDDVFLFFAAEHLTQPSSVMGHIMLGVSGINQKGINVEHAITFFTELDFSQPLDFFTQTLITGKEGVFIVAPLRLAINKYRFDEQRNVWRYSLKLTAEQKELLAAHLWELKNIQIPYLFQSHNCATFTLDLLRAVVADEHDRADLISPIDVVRFADEQGVIQNKEILPSDLWQVKMLGEFTSAAQKKQVLSWLDNPDLPAPQTPVTQELARSLWRYQLNTQGRSVQQQEQMAAHMAQWPVNQIDLTAYKDPLKSSPDSHVAAGWLHTEKTEWLTLSWLPAAHDLQDDNRNQFSESSLGLSSLKARVAADGSSAQLDRWMLYETRALNPMHPLTEGVSGYFRLGFERSTVAQHFDALNFVAEGGGGLTLQLHRDVGLYFLAGPGARLYKDDAYLFIRPEIGAWIYEVGDMKSWLKAYSEISRVEQNGYTWQVEQSIGLGAFGRLLITAKQGRYAEQTYAEYELALRHYF